MYMYKCKQMYGDFLIWGYLNSWIVLMEHLLNMDDLRVPVYEYIVFSFSYVR